MKCAIDGFNSGGAHVHHFHILEPYIIRISNCIRLYISQTSYSSRVGNSAIVRVVCSMSMLIFDVWCEVTCDCLVYMCILDFLRLLANELWGLGSQEAILLASSRTHCCCQRSKLFDTFFSSRQGFSPFLAVWLNDDVQPVHLLITELLY